MKSILFIGGAGFIGFHLTRYFSEKYPDYRLVHLDKLLFPGCLDNVHACRKMPRYFFEHGDASISQRVVKLFQEFDIRGVIMLVATGAFDASVKNLRPVVDSNFLSVFTVLEAARNHWQSTPGVYKLGYDDFTHKKCLIIGRSIRVGRPLAEILTQKNMTVTLAHSKTSKPVFGFDGSYDFIVSAIGKPNYWGKEYPLPMIKYHQNIIIDVGMNYDENGQLCGDVDRQWFQDNSFNLPDDDYYERDYITPVTNGVGLVTTTVLFAKLFSNAADFFCNAAGSFQEPSQPQEIFKTDKLIA